MTLKYEADQGLDGKRQADQMNKKLKNLYSNNLDVKKLMSDDMLVNRFTEHLCNILFNFADPWLKNKYKTYKGGDDMSFFDRMQQDMKKREDSKAEQRKKGEEAPAAVSRSSKRVKESDKGKNEL